MFAQQNKFPKLNCARLLMLILGLAMIFALVAIGIAQRTSPVNSAVSVPTESPGAATQESRGEAKALLTAIQPYGFEPADLEL